MDETRIPEPTARNFEQLGRAFKHGQVCIMRARRADQPDKYVTLVCAASKDENDEIQMTPFAMMLAEDGNPFDQFIPASDDQFENQTTEEQQ